MAGDLGGTVALAERTQHQALPAVKSRKPRHKPCHVSSRLPADFFFRQLKGPQAPCPRIRATLGIHAPLHCICLLPLAFKCQCVAKLGKALPARAHLGASSMDLRSGTWLAASFSVALLLSVRGLKKGSLSPQGMTPCDAMPCHAPRSVPWGAMCSLSLLTLLVMHVSHRV